jgi:RimJ/RimL family protein N-acetyltransferase
MYGPVIEGKLLRLRPPRMDDATAMVGWFEDMEVTHFLFVRMPPSLEQEKEWLDNRAKDPDSITWVVEIDGRAAGTTGIQMIDWKNGFGTTGTIIGDKTVWRRGVGREVMQLRAEFLFTNTSLRKLKSGYLEGNVASARAQAACGYVQVGRWRKDRFVDGGWRDVVLTELLREEWETRRSV